MLCFCIFLLLNMKNNLKKHILLLLLFQTDCGDVWRTNYKKLFTNVKVNLQFSFFFVTAGIIRCDRSGQTCCQHFRGRRYQSCIIHGAVYKIKFKKKCIRQKRGKSFRPAVFHMCMLKMMDVLQTLFYSLTSGCCTNTRCCTLYFWKSN